MYSTTKLTGYYFYENEKNYRYASLLKDFPSYPENLT